MAILTYAFSRYLLYSSYFAMVGAIFSHQSFGRIVGVISVIAGLVGLLQIPLTQLVTGPLNDDFIPVQIAMFVLIALQFIPGFAMLVWGRQAVRPP